MKFFSRVNSRNLIFWGYGLEFFDLYLYIHFAKIINQHFFEGWNQAFLDSFALFNLYLLAPVACMVSCYYGDLFGRRKVIVSTAFLMAVSSFAIVFLPDSQTWGVWAGCALIGLRVIQGISLSGETIISWVFVTEQSEIAKTPYYLSILAAVELGGGIVALLLGYLTIEYNLYWKIPFIFTSAFIVMALILRTHLKESKDYRKHLDEKISMVNSEEIIDFYKKKLFKTRNFLCSLPFFYIYPICFIIAYIYLGDLLIKKGFLSQSEVFLNNICLSIIEIAVGLLVGKLFLVFPSWRPQKVGLIKFSLLFIASLQPILNPSFFLETREGIFVLQVFMVTLSMTSIVIGSCFKTLPVIGRCLTAGTSWAIAKIFSFFILLGFNYYNQIGNLENIFIILSVLTIGVLIGIYFYIPIENFNEAFFKQSSRKKQLYYKN